MAMAATMPMIAGIARMPRMTPTIRPARVGLMFGRGAPFVGFPHFGQGAYETAGTGFPQ